MNKYKLVLHKARVDFGNDTFFDCDPDLVGYCWESKDNLKGLAKFLSNFIKNRDGQIIESGNGTIVFDTRDMTVTVRVCLGDVLTLVSDKEFEEFYNHLEKFLS